MKVSSKLVTLDPRLQARVLYPEQQMAVVKPKDSKMISDNRSLSYPSSFSLTHALQLSVSDCIINRETHSLFILITDFTITY